MDKLGSRAGNLIFSLIVTIGQAVFAIGASIKSYPIALLGRSIYGVGGESLNVSQFNTIVQ